jgi:hypothetical protein
MNGLMWNKCSEKLPEVGMLVVSRQKVMTVTFYDADEVHINHRGDLSLVSNPDKDFTKAQESKEWKEIQKD